MIICHAIVLSVLFFCTVVSLDTLSLSRSHSGAYTLYVMSNALNQVLLTFSAIYIYIAICCVFFFLFSAHNAFMYRFGNFDASVQLKTVSVCFWHIPVAIVSLFFPSLTFQNCNFVCGTCCICILRSKATIMDRINEPE